jgi:T5SS/PEP-CTERM-associated repeat protein
MSVRRLTFRTRTQADSRRSVGPAGLKPARRFARHAIATAVLLAGGLGGGAQAQYYSQSGDVNSWPVNLVPLDPSIAIQSLGSNQLFVGGGGDGSFSSLAGSVLSLGGVTVATNPGNNGIVYVQGRWQVSGTVNRLEIGNWGTGSLVVSDGGLLDATANASACIQAGAWCNNFIGNAAGSSGTLTVTGAGSEVRALRYFGVGGGAVFTQAANGFNFGTPGADSHGAINVLNGGTLRTDNTAVSLGPGGGAPTGTEHSFANVVVDGIGSRWIVSPDRFNGGPAVFSASLHALAAADIQITGGGQLVLDGSSAPDANHIINLGAGGSTLMRVNGAGSSVLAAGRHAQFSVGSAAGGQAVLNIENGALVRAGNLTVAAARGANGEVKVDGGSLLLNGTDAPLSVGSGGHGALLVLNGGLVDATQDAANCVGTYCGSLMAQGAGSTGTLTISGTGSEVRLLRNLDTANARVDLYNGVAGGTALAVVNVSGGGVLRSGGANLGTDAVGPGGNGNELSVTQVNLDGAGSAWYASPNAVDGGGVGFNLSNHARAQSFVTLSNGALLSIDSAASGREARLAVGNRGQGQIDVLSGSQVHVVGSSSEFWQGHVNIGEQTGSRGSVNVDGAGSLFSVGGAIANLDVGGGAGSTGFLNVTNGGLVTAGGLNVGANGGTGTVLVDNARIEVNNGFYGRLFVGANGNGSLTVRNGGVVDATVNPTACLGTWCGSGVGNGAGASGLLRIEGAGSEVRIVRDFFTGNAWADTGFGTPGANTTATIQVVGGGTLRTERSNLGSGAGGPLSNGHEHSVTDVLVSGGGSSWFVTPASLDGGDASLNLASVARSESFVTVANGGLLHINAVPAGAAAGLYVGNGGTGRLDITAGGQVRVTGAAGTTSNSYVTVAGQAGSQGTVNVSGAGSSLTLSGRVANLDVGNGAGAVATMRVADGGKVSSGGLNLGSFGATGKLTVDNGLVEVNQGTYGRLIVGNNSVGNLLVTNGGVLDAALNPGACVGSFCASFVGYRAGSSGSMTIQGTGSEVRTLRSFTAGDVWVDSFAGVAGGTTTADIKILAGGSLRTQGASLGSGNNGPQANGEEKSFVSVLIDGTGSQWVVTRNLVDNAGSVGMTVAGFANATANVTVSNGGLLRIDGTGGTSNNNGISIGAGGKGSVTVTGAHSRLETAGPGRYINVGQGAAGTEGSFGLLAGGQASAFFLNVGRDGAKGSVLIDGAGSLVTLSGVNTGVGSLSQAFMSVGRNGGTGALTLSNGGQLVINDGGQDSRTLGSVGAIIGRENGGVGSLLVTGAGSKLSITSTSLAPAAGVADNFNPFLAVGRDAGSVGDLKILAGGEVSLLGSAHSTTTFSRGTGFYVGGNSDTVVGGTGAALVSGLGSALHVDGVDGFVAVGMDSIGTLTLADQALLTTNIINVGRSTAGVGSLLVDHSQITLSGQQTGSTLSGAGLSIGNRGGTGSAVLSNGSVLAITNMGSAGAGLNLGGTGLNPFGNGQLTMSGGSRVQITTAPGLATLSIGRDGSGQAALSGVSVIDIGDGTAYVGRLAGGSGALTLSSGSSVRAGVVNIGGGSDSVAGGVGTVTVSGGGSELRASGAVGFIGVGRLGGVGVLSLSNGAQATAVALGVGRGAGAVGNLLVSNAAVVLSGQQTGGLQLGAGLGIGQLGGTGLASFTSSTVSISNAGTLDVGLNIGGTAALPGGNGTLLATDTSFSLAASTAGAHLVVGYGGTGSATLNHSTVNIAGATASELIIARQAGSAGTLVVNSGSVINATYVGVGSLQGGIDGGQALLKLNASTLNATTLEIGRYGVVGGTLGVINANVINRGVLSPGNSPGTLTINGNLDTHGGKLVLEVEDDGTGHFVTDQLVLSPGSVFDLHNTQVEFHFLGSTNPNQFAAGGGMDLDNFLKIDDGHGQAVGLSTVFASQGSSWEQALSGSNFSASSSSYQVTLQMNMDHSGSFALTAAPVPEPQTWLLWMGGLLGLGARARRRAGVGGWAARRTGAASAERLNG